MKISISKKSIYFSSCTISVKQYDNCVFTVHNQFMSRGNKPNLEICDWKNVNFLGKIPCTSCLEVRGMHNKHYIKCTGGKSGKKRDLSRRWKILGRGGGNTYFENTKNNNFVYKMSKLLNLLKAKAWNTNLLKVYFTLFPTNYPNCWSDMA